MTGTFTMGFWNYVRTGDLVPAAAAQEWKALGFNMAMSTEYDCGVNRKEEMLAELDAAEAQGIREILCDRRTRWQTLREQGEAAFRRGVAAVRDDFCSHAAVFGLHIGDEPNKDDFAVAVDAARIVKEMIPGKAAFINFYPADNGYWFTDLMGTDASGYDRKLKSAVTQAGLPVLCYDCYTQCFAYDKESGLHRYFANLNLFRRVAEQTGVPLWTSLLSVGHWKYRVPTEDDFRWQISTAAAHGCKGILWFFVYERLLESSYRNSPIDQFGERTPTFGALSRQNRIFMKHYADKFAAADLIRVEHYGACYGDTPAFCSDALAESVSADTCVPLVVSRFRTPTGKALVVVNASQELPALVTARLGRAAAVKDKTVRFWLAPGQLHWIDLLDADKTSADNTLRAARL